MDVFPRYFTLDKTWESPRRLLHEFELFNKGGGGGGGYIHFPESLGREVTKIAPPSRDMMHCPVE